jgi:hypothetical protein
MLIVDSLIISGVKFVLTRLAEAVEAEMYDESSLREELLAAQMKLELGEITDEEFAQIEEQVIEGMREVRARQKAARGEPAEGEDDQAAAAGATAKPADDRKFTIESVDAQFGFDEEVKD